MAKYLFRIDDVHPKMDWQKFNELRKIFDEYQIKPLIAVIPDNRCAILDKDESNPNFWQTIREFSKNHWTIAMHGSQHGFINNQPGILKINSFSEFASLSYADQSEKIKKGKAVLEENGIRTNIFVAPAHSFDATTIRVLKENDFSYISDGMALWPFKKYNIIWLPQVFGKIRKFPLGFIVFCIHVNTITDVDIQELSKFILRNKKNIINFYEFIDIASKMSVAEKFLTFLPNTIFGVILKIVLRFKHNL